MKLYVDRCFWIVKICADGITWLNDRCLARRVESKDCATWASTMYSDIIILMPYHLFSAISFFESLSSLIKASPATTHLLSEQLLPVLIPVHIQLTLLPINAGTIAGRKFRITHIQMSFKGEARSKRKENVILIRLETAVYCDGSQSRGLRWNVHRMTRTLR